MLLLHGAGSGTDVPVLAGLAGVLPEDGWTCVALEQPYRVAGRRAPAPAPQLDAVVVEVVAHLRAHGHDGPLVLVGRSSGARVGVRVAAGVGAKAVVALGFPLVPPGGRPSRLPELDGAGVPVLVVQGSRDSFGMPESVPAGPGRPPVEVHVVEGADHVLRTRRADGRSEEDCVREAIDVVRRWCRPMRRR